MFRVSSHAAPRDSGHFLPACFANRRHLPSMPGERKMRSVLQVECCVSFSCKMPQLFVCSRSMADGEIIEAASMVGISGNDSEPTRTTDDDDDDVVQCNV